MTYRTLDVTPSLTMGSEIAKLQMFLHCLTPFISKRLVISIARQLYPYILINV